MHPIQSGSQLSVNQEAIDPSLVAGTPVVPAVTTPSINPCIGSVDSLLTSSYTTPSSTPLQLELHIDEDGSSAQTVSAGSIIVIAPSKSPQYSQTQQKDDDNSGSVISKISQVESLSISSTICPSSQTEVNSPTHLQDTEVSVSKVSSLVLSSSSRAPTARGPSPVVVFKSPSPVTVSVDPNPILTAKSPGPPDLKSPSPISKSNSPSPISQSREAKTASPVTVPRLSSPVPKSASPVPVPNISSSSTVPKSASPETVPKSASPVSLPRLSSPVPKIASPVTVPNISSSSNVPKSSNPETFPKNAGPVKLSRPLSPVTVPKSDGAVLKSPSLVTRKTFTVPCSSSPRASPLNLAALPSNSLSSYSSEKQRSEILDLTWPCREPLLDDALDKLLSADSTQLSENQPPASFMPEDEDRSWEEEDGIYPDLSREGTLTPMTESSWMDECFTPSTCPGTPDATLDLPMQQPSAVERLSASGQVGCLTCLSQKKLLTPN